MKINICIFACTTVLYIYTINHHVRSKINREFYHGILYKTNEECIIRIRGINNDYNENDEVQVVETFDVPNIRLLVQFIL